MLHQNDLTGPIPPEFINLAPLEWVQLGGNDITDCIPWYFEQVPINDLATLGLPGCE